MDIVDYLHNLEMACSYANNGDNLLNRMANINMTCDLKNISIYLYNHARKNIAYVVECLVHINDHQVQIDNVAVYTYIKELLSGI
jgi:hypothetical protein